MTELLTPISYSDANSEDDHRAALFIDKMMAQLRYYRCIRLIDAPFVKSGLLNRAILLNKKFHELPDDVKAKYAPTMRDGSHKYNGFGYHPVGCEVDKQGELVGRRSFFTCLRPTPEGHPPYPHYFEDNPNWPQEPSLSDFEEVNTQMMESLISHFISMMQLICIGMDYNYEDIRPCIADTALDYRGNRYQRLKDTAALVEHVDNTLLTYVFGTSCDGLKISAKNGEWIPFRTKPDEVTIIIGDVLQMLTSDELQATPHSVWTDNIQDEYRDGFNAFFTGSASAPMPVFGDRDNNTLLKTHPEREGLSPLDVCDTNWRAFVADNLSDITFYPQERPCFRDGAA